MGAMEQAHHRGALLASKGAVLRHTGRCMRLAALTSSNVCHGALVGVLEAGCNLRHLCTTQTNKHGWCECAESKRDSADIDVHTPR